MSLSIAKTKEFKNQLILNSLLKPSQQPLLVVDLITVIPSFIILTVKTLLNFKCVQNCLAMVVSQSPHFSRSMPLLRSLHRLTVRFPIIYKVRTLTYQALSSKHSPHLLSMLTPAVERSGSGVELRTLDYENPGSNPGCGVKTLGKFFHSTLVQFTQLFK